MKRKFVIAVISVTVLGIGLAGCSNPDAQSNSSSGAAGKPFEVLAILPITGPLAANATQQSNGLKASAIAINKSGGIDGRQVTVKTVDDKADPTQAVTLLQGEINSATPPDMVWAGATSTEALALVPILTSSKIISMSTASSAALGDPTKYPYHFGVSTANNQNYPALLSEAKAEGATKLGFITGNDALGTDNLKQMTTAAAAANLPLSTQVFDSTATDLTGPMDALKATSPDFLVLSSYGAPAGYLLDARQKLNWSIPTIGDSGTAASPLPTDPSTLVGVKLQAHTTDVLSDKASWIPSEQPALDLITAQGPITSSAVQPLIAYDSIQLVAAAASQAGGTGADQMKSALENLKSPSPLPWTVFSSYGFTSTSHFPTLPAGAFAYPAAGPETGGFFK